MGAKGVPLAALAQALVSYSSPAILDRSYTAVIEMGAKGAPLAALAQALVSYSSPAI